MNHRHPSLGDEPHPGPSQCQGRSTQSPWPGPAHLSIQNRCAVFSKGDQGGAQQKGQTGGSSSPHLGLCPASSSSLSPKCPLVPAHPPPCSLSGAGSWPLSSVGNCPLGLPPGLSPSPTLVWLLKPPALTAPPRCAPRGLDPVWGHCKSQPAGTDQRWRGT